MRLKLESARSAFILGEYESGLIGSTTGWEGGFSKNKTTHTWKGYLVRTHMTVRRQSQRELPTAPTHTRRALLSSHEGTYSTTELGEQRAGQTDLRTGQQKCSFQRKMQFKTRVLTKAAIWHRCIGLFLRLVLKMDIGTELSLIRGAVGWRRDEGFFCSQHRVKST